MKVLLFLLFSLMLDVQCFAQINIWEGTSCNKKVEMTPYIAEGKDNISIVVCPGGSYYWHDMNTEGHDVAKWLQSQGITAFVLRYRTANVPAFLFPYRLVLRGNRYPDPQNDLKRALEIIRNNANIYGIDPNKVGAMGFSAGGHLVMSAAEFFSSEERPAFVVPIYPVVTMVEDCTHKRSRRALLGESRMRNKIMRDSLSLEKHVPIDCPPVFLVNCLDDPIVDYHNSELLDSALTSKKISHRYLQYKTGGHSFGASEIKGTFESRQWKNEFLNWLRVNIK